MKFIRKNNETVSEKNNELSYEECRKQLWKHMFLSVVAIVALAIACIAWFVANMQVNSSTSAVSAGFEPVKLATKGVRQGAEIDNLNLSTGEPYPSESVEEHNGKTYYCTDAGTIALRLSANDYELSPGSKGKVEFYIIPTGGASEVTLQIGLGGYGADPTDNKVKPIENRTLNDLISGHILLFDDYENGFYSNWLFTPDDSSHGIFNNAITINLSGKTVGVPVPVDFYWIWPLRYENIKNDFNDFNDNVSQFIEEQAIYDNMNNLTGDYRHSRVFLTDNIMSDNAARSKGYDLADEYIGSNAQYLYLTIQTSASDGEKGGPQ